MIMIFFKLLTKGSVFYASYFKMFWLVDTTHAQTTTFPIFEKESPVGKIENLFITVQWLTFSYMSQFVFVNISFIWSNLQEKQKCAFRSRFSVDTS